VFARLKREPIFNVPEVTQLAIAALRSSSSRQREEAEVTGIIQDLLADDFAYTYEVLASRDDDTGDAAEPGQADDQVEEWPDPGKLGGYLEPGAETPSGEIFPVYNTKAAYKAVHIVGGPNRLKKGNLVLSEIAQELQKTFAIEATNYNSFAVVADLREREAVTSSDLVRLVRPHLPSNTDLSDRQIAQQIEAVISKHLEPAGHMVLGAADLATDWHAPNVHEKGGGLLAEEPDPNSTYNLTSITSLDRQGIVLGLEEELGGTIEHLGFRNWFRGRRTASLQEIADVVRREIWGTSTLPEDEGVFLRIVKEVLAENEVPLEEQAEAAESGQASGLPADATLAKLTAQDPHDNFNSGFHSGLLRDTLPRLGEGIVSSENEIFVPLEWLAMLGRERALQLMELSKNSPDIIIRPLSELIDMFIHTPLAAGKKKRILLADATTVNGNAGLRHHALVTPECSIVALENPHVLHVISAIEFARSVATEDEQTLRDFYALLTHGLPFDPTMIDRLREKGMITLLTPRIERPIQRMDELLNEHYEFLKSA